MNFAEFLFEHSKSVLDRFKNYRGVDNFLAHVVTPLVIEEVTKYEPWTALKAKISVGHNASTNEPEVHVRVSSTLSREL